MSDVPLPDAPLLVRRRWLVFALTSLVCALVAGLGVPRLEFEVGHRSLFVEGDPALVRYDALETTFGSDDVVYLLVDVPDAFEEPHLDALVALGERLRALPFVEEVRSPLHSPVVFEGPEGAITSRSVQEADPQDEASRALWRQRVLGYRPFADLLIGAEGRQVGYTARLDPAPRHRTPRGRAALADALLDLLDDGPWRRYSKGVVGTPLVTTRVARILGREIGGALIGGLLVATVALALLLRSARAVVAPLAVVVASLALTFGLMGLVGHPLSTLSAILVTLVICVGVADAMHLVASHQRLARTGLPPLEAVGRALGEVWRPCLFTSLTTGAGFLALLSSQVAPVRVLGLYAAVGSGAALVTLLGLVPALVGGWRPGGPAAPADALPWPLGHVTGLRPGWVVALALVACAGLTPGIGRLVINQNLLRDLAPDEPLRRDLEFVHGRMGGTVAAEVVVEPREVPPDAIPAAALLRAVEGFERWLEQAHPAVAVVRGIPDGIAEVHRVWGGPREVPANDAAAAQLLLSLKSSDAEFCDAHLALDASALRVTARFDLIDSRDYQTLLARAQDELERRLGELGSGHITGGAMLLARSNAYLLATQLESFGLALLVVTALIALWTRELRLGLLSVVANLLPVGAVLGGMGWAGVEITTANALIATIAIGIIVDDTIHVTHALREATATHADPRAALRQALARAGRPVLFTTLVLAGCFGAYLASDLGSIRTFGAIATATFVAALVSDVVVLPALLRLWPGGSASS